MPQSPNGYHKLKTLEVGCHMHECMHLKLCWIKLYVRSHILTFKVLICDENFISVFLPLLTNSRIAGIARISTTILLYIICNIRFVPPCMPSPHCVCTRFGGYSSDKNVGIFDSFHEPEWMNFDEGMDGCRSKADG